MFFSVLSCPIARKHRLEEEEEDTEKPPSKRKAHPLKLALDEGFSADSDTSSEVDGDCEKDEDECGGAEMKEEPDNKEDAKQDGQTNPELQDNTNEGKKTFQMEKETPANEEGDFCVFNQLRQPYLVRTGD